MSASGFSAVPQLGFGQVRHARLKPVSNTFTYPIYFLMLPMRAMQKNGSGALAHNRSSLRKALWGYPAMTFGVIGRIHWQAFKLWKKRVPFVKKPQAPEIFVTR